MVLANPTFMPCPYAYGVQNTPNPIHVSLLLYLEYLYFVLMNNGAHLFGIPVFYQ